MNIPYCEKHVNLLGPLPLDNESIDQNSFTILIDGGVNHPIANLLTNVISIGDSDSAPGHKHTISLPTDKDSSDFANSLNYIEKGTKYVKCFGLFGGRLDHQMFIFGDICQYLLKEKNKIVFDLFNKNSIIARVLPPGEWDMDYIGEFSLLNFFQQKISVVGAVKYPISARVGNLTPLTSKTLSNVANGQFTIVNELPLIIYFNKEE